MPLKVNFTVTINDQIIQFKYSFNLLSYLEKLSYREKIVSLKIHSAIEDGYLVDTILTNNKLQNLQHLEMQVTKDMYGYSFDNTLARYLVRNERLKELIINDPEGTLTFKESRDLAQSLSKHPKLILFSQGEVLKKKWTEFASGLMYKYLFDYPDITNNLKKNRSEDPEIQRAYYEPSYQREKSKIIEKLSIVNSPSDIKKLLDEYSFLKVTYSLLKSYKSSLCSDKEKKTLQNFSFLCNAQAYRIKIENHQLKYKLSQSHLKLLTEISALKNMDVFKLNDIKPIQEKLTAAASLFLAIEKLYSDWEWIATAFTLGWYALAKELNNQSKKPDQSFDNPPLSGSTLLAAFGIFSISCGIAGIVAAVIALHRQYAFASEDEPCLTVLAK